MTVRGDGMTVGPWRVAVWRWSGGYSVQVRRGHAGREVVYWHGGETRGQEYPTVRAAHTAALEWISKDVRETMLALEMEGGKPWQSES